MATRRKSENLCVFAHLDSDVSPFFAKTLVFSTENRAEHGTALFLPEFKVRTSHFPLCSQLQFRKPTKQGLWEKVLKTCVILPKMALGRGEQDDVPSSNVCRSRCCSENIGKTCEICIMRDKSVKNTCIFTILK